MTAPHSLDSDYVREQLRLRATRCNDRPVRAGGEFVLYWMQSTHRLDENWALRFATLAADALDRPLVIHQGLDPTYPYASDRIHSFVIAGARDTAARARELGLHYQFALRRRRDDDRRVVDRLAARSCLVVTDLFPTAGIAERVARFAARCDVRVHAVESHAVVPSGVFDTEQYSAPVIRPKIRRVRELYLETVEDRPPRHALAASHASSLDVDALDLAEVDVAAECARCEIDHEVPPSPLVPGRAAALARLDRFVAGGLADYSARRREPADDDGTSRLSPYLHFGQIGAAEVARRVLEAGPASEADAYLDELLTWRELALNFCLRNPHFRTFDCLPAWARATLAAHDADERPVIVDEDALERGESGDPLWDAAQQELRRTGTIHNAMRMLWGKTVLLWTPSHAAALALLLRLNDRWALDGRDPSGYLNVLWCFGRYDRPYPERPVFGKVRPMSLARAYDKFDAAAYIAREAARGAPSLHLPPR